MSKSVSLTSPGRAAFLTLLFTLLLMTGFAGTAFANRAENTNNGGKNTNAKVHEYNLENGLKVLVKQDKRAPIAVLQVWYRIGTSYEHEGITGLSHALEHMMFKGTHTRKSGEFERLMAENGAENNAFTSQDYTAYYEVLAKDRLEAAIEIEADRMRNLVLDETEFKKEIEVVKEERRWRTDDKPASLLREQFNAIAFLNSPYRAPVIGWMVDLEGMKLADLKDWYEKWYQPNNAIIVVVGDVEPDEVNKLVIKYFGKYPEKALPEVKPRTEVAQNGLRELTLKLPAKVASLRMGYKTPGMISAKNGEVEAWEPYALEVLAYLLSGGDSARLQKNLVRGQAIAAGASAGYYSFGRLPNLFLLTGTPARDVETSKLKEGILAEIEKLKHKPVSELELKRVKAGVVAQEIYERDSIQHMATLLGSLEATGLGYKMIDEYVNNIKAVTATQVQAVAKKYLIEKHLTVAELVPLPIETKSRVKGFRGGKQ